MLNLPQSGLQEVPPLAGPDSFLFLFCSLGFPKPTSSFILLEPFEEAAASPFLRFYRREACSPGAEWGGGK
jgi:hypothetical protein